jgi:chemotaxis protein methyltransferase CheR
MHLTPAAFDDIRKAVHDLCGIVIAPDKQYLVKARLEPILLTNGLASYELLVRQLREPNSILLRDQMVEAITTNETSFNRDGHPFEALRRFILPELASRLIERRATTRLAHSKARIWSAAASTGQEAYSVAMAVADCLDARSAPGLTPDDFPILASDISSKALAFAREARYSSAEVDRGLSALERARFVRQENGAWIVNAALRRMVEFRRLNLVQPLPDLGTFDLILCRNLLIYIDDATRRRLCRGLHSALNPRGILMIGAAESLYGVTDAFATERFGSTVVYRKHG